MVNQPLLISSQDACVSKQCEIEEWEEKMEKTCYHCHPLYYQSIAVDCLYFSQQESNIRFAAKTPDPQSEDLTFYVINPKWKYDIGWRANLAFSFDSEWECNFRWTYINNHANSTPDFEPNFGVFTSLTSNGIYGYGNSFAQSIKGKWSLLMNVADLELVKPFYINSALLFRPLLGIKGCYIKRDLQVNYTDYQNNSFTALNPNQVNCSSWVHGIGPEVGLDVRFLTRSKLDLFCRTVFSSMVGNFHTNTKYSKYTQFVVTPASFTKTTIKDDVKRLFCMLQLQAAVSKRWDICGSTLEILIGWETQFWIKQLRLDTLNTLDTHTEESDLTLYGPFARIALTF